MARIEMRTKLPIEIKSGDKKPFTVTLEDWTKPTGGNKSKPQLFFSVSGGEGVSFEKNTLVTKPTRKDMELEVVIDTNDSSVSPLEFKVTVKKEAKPIRIFPIQVDLISGGTIRFTSESPFKGFCPVYKIKDFGLGMGNINPSSGEYKAPDIITEEKTITIRAIDQNYPGPEINFAEATITLRPIEMRDRDFEADPLQPRVIRAGSKATQLNIESHNDTDGLTNYSCKFVGTIVGTLESGGKYTPPKMIGASTEVVIEATSALDTSKKVKTHRITVAPALCSKCGAEMANGNCAVCNIGKPTGAEISNVIKKFMNQTI